MYPVKKDNGLGLSDAGEEVVFYSSGRPLLSGLDEVAKAAEWWEELWPAASSYRFNHYLTGCFLRTTQLKNCPSVA